MNVCVHSVTCVVCLTIVVLVVDVGLVRVLVDEVVHGAGSRAPAEGVAHPLGDLADALVAALQGRLVELRVQELRPGVQAHLRRERAHLGVRGRGVRNQGGGLLAVDVLPQTLHDLRRVVVEVVGDVREGDLAAVLGSAQVKGLRRQGTVSTHGNSLQ